MTMTMIMIIGMIIMGIIAVNIHYMMKIIPESGGIFSFTKKTFGYDHGYVAAWFMILIVINGTMKNG